MKNNNAVSIIVPTLNEADNIIELVQRVDTNLKKLAVPYEMIVIDDHSTDDTVSKINELALTYNVRVVAKRGKPGKAYSLLEGFEEARNPIICMIDADLQYPPESIGDMHKLLTLTGADVVISERTKNETSFLRKLSSKTFNFLFARLLFGIGYDTQSGLKLFRKSILKDFRLSPSPWSFDLEFLVRSLENKRSIVSHSIPFTERNAGITKVKVLNVTFELAKASVLLRVNTSVQKLRAGLRANSRFVSRTFPVLLAMFSLLAVLDMSSTKAQAISSPLTGNQNLAISVPIAEPLLQTQQSSNSKPVQSPPQTTTVDPANNQSSDENTQQAMQPTTNSNSPQGQSSAVNTTVNSQPQNTTAQNRAVLSSQQSPNKSLTVSSSTNATTVAFQNNDSLSPATAAKPYSAFAYGYPTASISTAAKDTATKFSVIALSVGFLGILTAILIEAFIRTPKSTFLQKNQR